MTRVIVLDDPGSFGCKVGPDYYVTAEYLSDLMVIYGSGRPSPRGIMPQPLDNTITRQQRRAMDRAMKKGRRRFHNG